MLPSSSNKEFYHLFFSSYRVAMKTSLPVTRPQSSESDSDMDQLYDRSIIVPTKVIALAESFEKKEHSWYRLN